MNLKNYLTIELSKHTNLLPKGKSIEDAVNLFILGMRAAGWCNKTAISFSDKFPEKIPNKKYYIWFLSNKGVKWCKRCDEVLPLEAFNKNISTYDGRQSYCVECTSEYMTKYSDRGAKQRAKVLQAMPPWVDEEEIKRIYKKCPENHHVDHIVPLNGTNVCGLHVPWNLQYLPASDNIKKSNKYDGGWARWDGSTFTP